MFCWPDRLEQLAADLSLDCRSNNQSFPAVSLRVLDSKDQYFRTDLADQARFEIEDAQHLFPDQCLRRLHGEPADRGFNPEFSEINFEPVGALWRRRLKFNFEYPAEADLERIK